MGAVRRLFVGLPLPDELAQRAALEAERVLGDGPRLVAASDLHVTLDFLGAVDEDELPARLAALARALAGARAPRLVLGRAGGFPDDDEPRVLWLGFDEPSREALRTLHEAARGARGASGDPLESWCPHVTLGRLSRGDLDGRRRAAAALEGLCVEGRWTPEAVVLFESRPEEGGVRYHPLASWPLGA